MVIGCVSVAAVLALALVHLFPFYYQYATLGKAGGLAGFLSLHCLSESFTGDRVCTKQIAILSAKEWTLFIRFIHLPDWTGFAKEMKTD